MSPPPLRVALLGYGLAGRVFHDLVVVATANRAHVPQAEAALRAGARPGDGARWGIPPREAWGEIVRGDAREPAEPAPGDWPAFYAGVARAIRDGAPPPVDPWDAVTVLRILEAARRSAAEGTVVRLGP